MLNPFCRIFFQETVSIFLENLTDEELKKESKTEGKNDTLSVIINALKCLASRDPKLESKIKDLEMFRLKTILRFLFISCIFVYSTEPVFFAPTTLLNQYSPPYPLYLFIVVCLFMFILASTVFFRL